MHRHRADHASRNKVTQTVIRRWWALARSYNVGRRFQIHCRWFLLCASASEDAAKHWTSLRAVLEVKQSIFGIDILKYRHIGYLLVCNKLPKNLVAWAHRHLLPPRFCGSGIWEKLGSRAGSGSHEVVVTVSAGAVVTGRLGRGWRPGSRWACLQTAAVLSWRHGRCAVTQEARGEVQCLWRPRSGSALWRFCRTPLVAQVRCIHWKRRSRRSWETVLSSGCTNRG